MPEDVKVGDVLKVKSGGPKMTVVDVETRAEGKIQVSCTWFTNQGREEGTFPPDALERADDTPRPAWMQRS